MIYDRTQLDVENSKTIREEKVKKFLSLTAAESRTLERGMLTISTLNRIEEKQSELKQIFYEMGYYNVQISNSSWSYTKIFGRKDFERIVENIEILKRAFFVFASTPENPTVSYHYENLNKIEKILYDLEDMSQEIKILYLECGNFECGEDQ